jgi:predicted acyl esterase
VKMRDGITISNKAIWDMSPKEHLAILLKRTIALPSKMLGFKPFCLYLATWLLAKGYIGEWVWLFVLMMVLFGIVGLKVAGGMLKK